MHIRSCEKTKIAGLIILFFIIINLVFNFPLWKQAVSDDSKTLTYHGELLLLHLSSETVYQNILEGQNPFTTNPYLMYPFGANYAVNDLAPINGYYFLALRPFFSIHQSISLIAATSIFLAHIFMYLFLRRLKISRPISLIMATSFGFTPYLAARMGSQPSYNSTFIFPLIGIMLHGIFSENTKFRKFLYSVGLGFSFFLLLLSNLNYTIIFAITIGLYLLYLAFTKYPLLLKKLKENILFFFTSGLTAIILLYPWIKSVAELIKEIGIPHGSAAGMILFSGHIFGLFIPSQWNPTYQPLISALYKFDPYLATQSEGFIYPGLIILFAFAIYFIFRRKLPTKLKEITFPHVFVAFAGAILSLGPVLHIGSQYIFHFQGKPFSIPMPFLIFTKIPFLENFRSPGRLSLILVFAGTIAAAYVINYFFDNIKSKFRKVTLFIIMLSVVLLDQNFMHVPAPQQTVPFAIYDEVAKDKEPYTVMEIPFTLRDGLQYLGNMDSIFYQLGHFTYKKSVIGTHIGRFNQYILDYYRMNPFIGYIGQLVDSNLDHAELYDPLKVFDGVDFDRETAQDAVNFLDIDAVILKLNEDYTAQTTSILLSLGYEPSTEDNGYLLYRRVSENRNQLCIPFGQKSEVLYLARGWESESLESKRWTVGKKASFLVKVSDDTKLSKIEFVAESLTDNIMEVHLGDTSTTINLKKGEFTYKIPFEVSVEKGLSLVNLTFSETTTPASIIPGNVDNRALSARFSSLCLE